MQDSNVVDHTKVQVNLVTVVEAVVTDDQGMSLNDENVQQRQRHLLRLHLLASRSSGRYLAVKDEKGRLNIPSAVLTRPRQFKLAAVELVRT
jgi:hypothetical protein